MSKRYKKKAGFVDAVLFNGENFNECKDFIGDEFDNALNYPNVRTKEGVMRVSEGDYILKGIHGEFYPCKPDIFVDAYEEVY